MSIVCLNFCARVGGLIRILFLFFFITYCGVLVWLSVTDCVMEYFDNSCMNTITDWLLAF